MKYDTNSFIFISMDMTFGVENKFKLFKKTLNNLYMLFENKIINCKKSINHILYP